LPLVSVTLPIYNAEPYLAECIESIKAQTFTDFEVIAVLDGCLDRSEKILMDLKDDRFVVVKKERNEGLVAALNYVIFNTTAPLIARMDADDLMLPTRLEKQVAFMQQNPDVDVLGTWFDYTDPEGKPLRPAFRFPTVHDEIVRAFRRYNALGHPTVMFRADRVRAVGGYAVNVPYSEDLTLWLKCLAAGYRFATLPEVLLTYREHRGQLTRQRRSETFRLANLAYQQFGPQIWRDDPPDIEFGAPLHRRIARRIRRILGIKRSHRA
jgi:glycosyltransferase involved in cell wall biosynthesis